jgi:chromosome partitioning protein
MVISFTNWKGGVGKTVSAVNIAHLSAIDGNRTLLLDGDPQGNATSIFASRYEYDLLDAIKNPSLIRQAVISTRIPNLEVLPASSTIHTFAESGKMAHDEYYAILSRLPNYDVVIIDTPPAAMGILSWNAIYASDYYMVPVEASNYWSIDGLDSLHRTINNLKSAIGLRSELLGVFLTRFDRRKAVCLKMAKLLKNRYGDRLCDYAIPTSSSYELMSVYGRTIFELDKSIVRDRDQAAMSYVKLWQWINNQVSQHGK